MFEEMKVWRQELHSIPEIGLEEYETSKYIKSKLTELNIEFKEGYANTGIVARVKGSKGDSDKSIGRPGGGSAPGGTEGFCYRS